MKKLFVMLAALLALALPQAAKAVDVEGIYVGGLAGFNFLDSTKSHSHENFKAGWLAGGNVGYRTCGGLRAEAEISYRSNKHKHAHRPVQTWSFMANGIYEIDYPCWCITPYVGAGIGYDRIKHKRCHDTVLVDEERSHNDHDNGFAWQLIVGGMYDIDECLEMGVDYRFHKWEVNKSHNRLYNNTVAFRINWFM